MSVDVYEVICKIVHLTYGTNAFICKPAHFRPTSSALTNDLLSSDPCRKWAGSASNQLTSGSLLGQPYFGSLTAHFGPLLCHTPSINTGRSTHTSLG